MSGRVLAKLFGKRRPRSMQGWCARYVKAQTEEDREEARNGMFAACTSRNPSCQGGQSCPGCPMGGLIGGWYGNLEQTGEDRVC